MVTLFIRDSVAQNLKKKIVHGPQAETPYILPSASIPGHKIRYRSRTCRLRD